VRASSFSSCRRGGGDLRFGGPSRTDRPSTLTIELARRRRPPTDNLSATRRPSEGKGIHSSILSWWRCGEVVRIPTS